MKSQSLNGVWKYRIGRGKETERTVPFSSLAVGHSECRKTFDLDYDSDVVLLKFDGITYNATVMLNGKNLGKMLPYSEYIFDITDTVNKTNNELLVEIEDINAPFGPSEGWENYGGIIRDVSLIYKSRNYIKDAFFRSELLNGYKDAKYTLDVSTSISCGKVAIDLSYNGKSVDAFESKNVEKIERKLENIHTWSPEAPNLYTLTVSLYDDENVIDRYECKVGFRELKCDSHRFYLNGNPVFLNGVCRHEMYGESGHTVTEEQTKRDLLMIKEMGCNFVRLVHYPHNKKTIELCDEIGLMCCEEPGLWQSDTSNKDVVNDCLEVLKRVVLRDRNYPSVVFWLCFNECDFEENFLKRSVEACKTYDGTRLVSGANNMSDEDTKKYYNLCGLDFYTNHPYYETFDKARKSAEYLNDKPLMFTEWGGYYVYDNPHLLKDFLMQMHELYKNEALAGQSIWYFAEINDFNRGGAACVDGLLKEALVDFERKPNLIYYAFCQALKEMKSEQGIEERYQYVQLKELSFKSVLKCSSEPDYERLLSICKAPPYTRLAKTRKKVISVGPALQNEEIFGISKIPYVVDTELTFSSDTVTDKISIIGAVSVFGGYPIYGSYGEEAVKITVLYRDGTEQSCTMKNGVDFTLAYTSLGSSRIEPYCENATRIATFSYDKNFESYIINQLDIEILSKPIDKIILKSVNNQYKILVYGIYAN